MNAKAEACFLNASKLKTQGKLEDAINQYKAALHANPEYMEAAYNLGNSYRELGNPVKAIESWRRVIEINPTFKDAHVNLGVALRSVGQLHDAIQHHRTALDLDNECIEACVNLGVALATRNSGGDCNHARTFYDRAIDLDPDYKPAHFNKGLLLVYEKELSLAEHCFNEALTIDPSDPLIHLNLAQLHLSINKDEWARAQSQARAETPMERAAQQLSYKNKDKEHQDDEEHKRLVEETTAKLFDKQESMERLEMAFVGFSTVIELDEDCAAAHAGIAMVHLERGETDYAEHLFQQASLLPNTVHTTFRRALAKCR